MLSRLEHPAADPAELGELWRCAMPWNLSTLRPSLPVKPASRRSLSTSLQMCGVAVPDAIGHDLVEAEAQLRRPAGEGNHELRIEERLAAGEAEDVDAVTRGRPRGSAGPSAMSSRSGHSIGTQQCGQVRLHW